MVAAASGALADIDDAAAALFYATTAAGLAAVGEGGFFKVIVEDRINTYQDIAGSAVLKSIAPKKADVDAIVARTSPFKGAVIGGAASNMQQKRVPTERPAR